MPPVSNVTQIPDPPVEIMTVVLDTFVQENMIRSIHSFVRIRFAEGVLSSSLVSLDSFK